ncbi:M81 family metallopeptidase [Acetobacter nitrogenifigens]|uniref:M81 family metallopeptidase n=1 Tax=Acetobacter nitrogenifigens TaxID=285268 RepID=UPI0004026C37|nr:M81 family metallopeptidase [Acetobacter nitrogenifigens]
MNDHARAESALRIFCGGIGTETNTSSPIPTSWSAFETMSGFSRNNLQVDLSDTRGEPFFELLGEKAQQDGHRISFGLMAQALPGGPTLDHVWETLSGQLIRSIVETGPYDVVILWLHGAMVSTTCFDCEGNFLARLRNAVGGNVCIGVLLDPHAHLTDVMIENSSIMMFLREYPHTDTLSRLSELYDACIKIARGDIHPVGARYNCQMIGLFPTSDRDMRVFTDELRSLEAQIKCLSISLVHGFPWGDTPFTGAQVLAYSDGDLSCAEEIARKSGERFYKLRRAFCKKPYDLKCILRDSSERPSHGPWIIADQGDNPGGGSPGDSMYLLRSFMEFGATDCVFGAVYDPVVVKTCIEAGRGAILPLRIGGKIGLSSGLPLDLDKVEVREISSDLRQVGLDGTSISAGAAAWLYVDGIDVLVISERSQVYTESLFLNIGLDVSGKRLIGLKSGRHFEADFSKFSEKIFYVATPGALDMNFRDFQFRERDEDFYPRVLDPLGLDHVIEN